MTALNIHQRIHACMTDVDYIQKERKQGMQYTIVSHDAVTAKVRPVLHKHGVVYYPVTMSRSQDGNRTEMDIAVRFVNIDKPEDYIDVVACGYGCDPQDKGPGKAMSYAVKYALLKVLGLETGDDPDTQELAHEPGPDPREAACNRIIAELRDARDDQELADRWKRRQGEILVMSAEQIAAVTKAKDAMKITLTRKAA